MKPQLRHFSKKAWELGRQIPRVVWNGIRWVIAAVRRVVNSAFQLVVIVLKAGVWFGKFLWRSLVAGIKSRRVRLIAVAALFLGWMSYLGYAALTKNRGPVVSRAQAAAAKFAVVATVEEEGGKPRSKVKVAETLWGDGLSKDAEIEVENITSATHKGGFAGPGNYLLLLTDPPFRVVGQQRSPGNDLSGTGPPLIYLWTDALKREFESLPRPHEFRR